MPSTKIAIIGTGSVGATTAYACLMHNLAAELWLVDINQKGCRGQVLDLNDALSLSATAAVKQIALNEARHADIIIIAAGKAQKPGQSRQELLQENKEIIASIMSELQPINPQACIIMVTNPVDTLTWHAQQLSGLPKEQVFGSGTLLDASRLRNLISQRIGVAEQSIHLYVVGEHGDSQVAAFATASVGGVPLKELLDAHTLAQLAQEAKEKVYDIIACKGCTCYGVASCIAAVCESIIFNQKRVIPVSCYIKEYDLCMSMPAVIGAQGIEQILSIPLSPQEKALLAQSVKQLQQMKALL